MAQDISLLGANYPDVPAVVLPKTGGGSARFTDVGDTTALPEDVAYGKVFYDSSGSRSVGTNGYSTGSLTAVQNVTHFGSRNSVVKHDKTVQVTAVIILDANIDAGGTVATLPFNPYSGQWAVTAIDNSYALPIEVTTDGRLTTVFALSSGTVLRVGFVYISQ